MRLCPWSLALASSIPVLGLESVCPRKGCPWPWPRIFFVSLASSLESSTPPLLVTVVTSYQRWSRGHKARGQGQKKNPRPRPRTAFRRTAISRPRTGMLEAKAKDQGHSRKCSPKKKGLQKSFSGNLQFIGVARIFDWGGLNHKSHEMTSSKICPLALNQDFAKGEGLN